MKKLLTLVAIAFGCISSGWAAAPAPLTSVRDIRSLSKAEAEQGYPVTFEATVTFYREYRHNLFVQDGDIGVSVNADTSARLVPGDRVLIKGTTAWSYRPTVASSDVTLLGHGALPKPVPATFDELIRGHLDAVLVTARGVVQSAGMDIPSANHEPGATLMVLMDGGYVDAKVISGDARALQRFLDAEVEITGVAGGKLDGKFQLTGIALHVTSFADIKILKSADVNPWSLPLTPMDQVISVYHVKVLTRRVRVSGTIKYFEPG